MDRTEQLVDLNGGKYVGFVSGLPVVTSPGVNAVSSRKFFTLKRPCRYLVGGFESHRRSWLVGRDLQLDRPADQFVVSHEKAPCKRETGPIVA